MTSRDNPSRVFSYAFGNAVFDETAMQLSVNGEPVELERRPLELLSVLLANTDQVMTKEELLDLVWVDQITVENVLANAVAKLRRALGPDLAERIVTHPRIGYRFVGPVERVAKGRKLSSALALKTGEAVPGRDPFQLSQLISSHSGREVWIARHGKTSEPRVFKFASDGQALSALKREVTIQRLLAASDHRADLAVPIMDWNFSQPPFFIECEYGGEDLRSFLAEGRLQAMSIEARADLVARICDAVAGIHSLGVLHKDLKPANVLVDPDTGRVRLIDFGSGEILERERLDAFGLTPLGFTQDSSDDTAATHGYLAPELLRGHPSSALSDIYALGVIAFQVLSGDLESAERSRPSCPRHCRFPREGLP